MSRLLSKMRLYLFLPEMRMLWYFLLLLVPLAILSFFYLPRTYAPVLAGIFVVMAAILFFVNLRLAKISFEVRLERNQIKTIIHDLQDGIIAYDPEFRILVFNKMAEVIFGLSADGVWGKIITPDKIREPGHRLLVQVLFPALAPLVTRHTSAEAYPQESHLSFDDPQLELKVTTSKIVDPGGRLLGFFKSIHDETREKALLRSKSDFITVAAHQLRTPLSAINWIFQGLSKNDFGAVDPSQKEVIDTGVKATNKLTRVVDDLLNVSKIEEGKFGYQFETVDITDLIEKILESYSAIAAEHKIKVYFDYTPSGEIPPFKIDPSRISIVFQNLLDNAIKYNVENGEVVVRIEKLKDKPYVQISVKDTGVGIPKEDMPRLFTKFFRAKNVLKFETEGSGLGIYIVKNIVRRHGGEIRAESELGRGTTFHFTLPLDEKLIPAKEVAYEEYL